MGVVVIAESSGSSRAARLEALLLLPQQRDDKAYTLLTRSTQHINLHTATLTECTLHMHNVHLFVFMHKWSDAIYKQT